MIETYLGIFGGNTIAAIATPVIVVIVIIVFAFILRKQRVSSIHDEDEQEPVTEEG